MPETALTESAAESCSLRRRHILCQAGLGVQGGGDVRQRPRNTLIEVSRLVGDYRVEIEAEAVVAPCG